MWETNMRGYCQTRIKTFNTLFYKDHFTLYFLPFFKKKDHHKIRIIDSTFFFNKYHKREGKYIYFLNKDHWLWNLKKLRINPLKNKDQTQARSALKKKDHTLLPKKWSLSNLWTTLKQLSSHIYLGKWFIVPIFPHLVVV